MQLRACVVNGRPEAEANAPSSTPHPALDQAQPPSPPAPASLGQLRPIGRCVLAGRPHRPWFPHGCVPASPSTLTDHLSKARLARVSSRPDLGSASLGFEPCAAYAGVALAPRRTQRALVGGRGLEREGRQEHPWAVKGRDIRRLLHRLPEAPCAATGVWAVEALLWSAKRSQEPGASAQEIRAVSCGPTEVAF
eukprot:scaffold78685_cov63-Phaeocystis_antarctica.AAC.3